MANAARLLGDLIDTWEGPANQAPGSNRGAGSADSIEFWRVHAQAVGYLVEIEEEINELASTNPDAEADSFFELLPQVYKAVFGMEPRWGDATGSGGNRAAINKTARQDLRRLSGLLATTAALRDLTKDQLEPVLAALSAALDEVKKAEFAEPRLRAELVDMLARAIDIVTGTASTTRQKHRMLRDASSAVVVASRAKGLSEEARNKMVSAAATLAVGAAAMFGNALVDNAVDAAFEPFKPSITTGVEKALHLVDSTELGGDEADDVAVCDGGDERP